MEDAQVALLTAVLNKNLEEHLRQIETSREHTNKVIEETIRIVVNGKIDKINAQNVSMEKKLDEFMVRAVPAVDFFDNINFTKRMFMNVLVGIAAIGAAYAAVKGIIKQ